MRGKRERDVEHVIIDGVRWDLLGPALVTPEPDRDSALADPDGAAAAATVVTPTASVFGAVMGLRRDRLSDAGLIDALAACERLKNRLDAVQADLLTEIAHRDPVGEEFLQDEVAFALHVTPGTAAEKLDTARALSDRLWDAHELLYDGHLPYTHAKILQFYTASCSDAVTGKVQAEVLRRAPGQTPGEFRAAVRRAVAFHDRKTQTERHREAVKDRRVVKTPDGDGMSWIKMLLPDDGAEVFWRAVNAWACKTGPDDTRTLDQRRADAAVELALAGLALPGVASARGVKPTVNVTVPISLFTHGDDQPGFVNGQPVVADIARRWAAWPGATFRYWYVDEAGNIVDEPCPQGPSRDEGPLVTESYTPTARIARHVMLRNPRCVAPGCGRPAYHCQLDHRIPWPEGATSAENLEPLCKRHHDLKHHVGWGIERGGGAYTWTSPTRHTYRYRPLEYPVPITDPPPTDRPPSEPSDHEPPPF